MLQYVNSSGVVQLTAAVNCESSQHDMTADLYQLVASHLLDSRLSEAGKV